MIPNRLSSQQAEKRDSILDETDGNEDQIDGNFFKVSKLIDVFEWRKCWKRWEFVICR